MSTLNFEELPMPGLREKILILSLTLFSTLFAFAQTAHRQVVPYKPGFMFTEGIYPDIADFRNNAPLSIENIVSIYSPEDTLFIQKVLSGKWIYYKNESAGIDSLLSREVWGACSRGRVFIQYQNKFSRLDVIGSICEFNNYQSQNETGVNLHQEQVRFVGQSVLRYYLDYFTGEVYPYNQKNLKKLISSDKKLLGNYLESKRDNEDLPVFRHYFNQDHPIYIPLYQ